MTDTYSDNTTFDPKSVVIKTVTFNDETGEEIFGTELKEGVDFTIKETSGNAFEINFNKDIKDAYKISYNTVVKKGITVEDEIKVENNVKAKTGPESGVNYTGYQSNIIKTVGTFNHETKRVDWSIEINNTQYEMNNLIIEDTYQRIPALNMEIVDGKYTFKITDKTDKKELMEGRDYTLEITKDKLGNETGFKVAFIGSYSKTNHKFTIEYTNTVDTKLIKAGDVYKNTAVGTWKDSNGDGKESTSSDQFTPKPDFSNNIGKSGYYNPINKEITWTINANLSRAQLKNSYVKDTISEKQTYVKDSLKVYEGQIDKDGKVTKKNSTEIKEVTIIQPDVNNGQTFNVAFPDGEKDKTKIYVIEYKTSLNDKVILSKYDNTATIHNEAGGPEELSASASVQPKYGGSFASKGGKAGDSKDPLDSQYVYWNILLNPSQSTIKDFVLKNEPSSNQVIEENSIVIYGAKYDNNGNLQVDKSIVLENKKDYTVDISTDGSTGKQVMTVRMLNEINKAYSLQYRSFVTSLNDNNEAKASNSASVSGIGTDKVEGTIIKEIDTNSSTHGGSAQGTKGKITLKKVDADDAKKSLTGAYFRLYNKNNVLVRKGGVSEDGIVTFGGLPYGEYTLFEIAHPDGYTISDELVKGKKIKIDAGTSKDGSVTNIENSKTKLIVRKYGEVAESEADGKQQVKNLPGARFQIDKKVDEKVDITGWQKVNIDPNITDANGNLEVRGLSTGYYRLTEIEAPEGYVKNEVPAYFTISSNITNQIPDVTVDYYNYQGAALLEKKNEKGDFLKNAEFSIFKVDDNGNKIGEAVQTGLVTDDKGQIYAKYLSPGNYAFQETKAPKGYIKNERLYLFTINKSSIDAHAILKDYPSAVNFKGTAKIIKRDKDGNVLAGADFKVIDENKKEVRNGLVSNKDGQVTVDELSPGKYQFVEVKAPKGYVVNTKPVDFEIKSSSLGKPETIEVNLETGFVNYKGSVLLVKYDDSFEAKPLKNAEFDIISVATGRAVNDKSLTTDENGRINYDGLAPGDYFIKETKAPNGFILNKKIIPFTIANQASGVPEVKVASDKFINYRGNAELTKTDARGEALEGAEFKVIDVNGLTVQEKLTSDENGVVNVEGLGPGKYFFKETKAPKGYMLNDAPKEFNISLDAIDKPVKVKAGSLINYQGSAELIKTGADSKVLQGAEFKVVDSKGNDVKTGLVSDVNGKVHVEGLAPGTYKFVEIKPPQDYQLSDKTYEFVIYDKSNVTPQPVEAGTMSNKYEETEIY